MKYIDKYNKWLKLSFLDEASLKELESIKDDDKEIKERFSKELEFGTAGMRGIMGMGSNRMNNVVIGRATLGLGNYLLNNVENCREKGVVLSHDNRHGSREFVLESAKILSYLGINVYIFDDLRPTPQLSFAVRNRKAAAGIMVTASHNPKNYNGYKVYGDDGAQIMPEVADKVTAEIESITDLESINVSHEYELVPVKDFEMHRGKTGNVFLLDENDDRAFLDAVKSNSIRKNKSNEDIKIVYSPLCGAGMKSVPLLLDELGYKNISIVEEEKNSDPEFAGIEYPNPEDEKALTRALALGDRIDADLVMATDPDSDRIGIAVKDNNGKLVLLSGNQTGGLIVNYIFEGLKELGNLPENPLMITTIVTSEFGADIAKSYGGCVEKTLTGFKFMADVMNRYSENGKKHTVMAYEESYGYLIGNHVRDKDAVVAAMIIAEMASYYKSKGSSIYNELCKIYKKMGYYSDLTHSFTYEGIEGAEKIRNIMKHFRENEVDSIAGIKVSDIEDYLDGFNSLPKSNVLKYKLEDGSWIALRPSGTEPKLKMYFGTKDMSKEKADGKLKALVDFFEKKIN